MHSNPCTFTFLANSAPLQVEDILDILKERMQNVYNGKSWSKCRNSPSVSCFKMSIFLHWRYEWIHNQKRKWKVEAITLLQSMDVLYLLNAHPPLWLNSSWSQRYQVQPIQLACDILGGTKYNGGWERSLNQMIAGTFAFNLHPTLLGSLGVFKRIAALFLGPTIKFAQAVWKLQPRIVFKEILKILNTLLFETPWTGTALFG